MIIYIIFLDIYIILPYNDVYKEINDVYMKKLDYDKYKEKFLTKDILNMISAIHEYKGKTTVISAVKKDTLNSLVEVAEIHSIISSNRIEGIYTSEKRLNELVNHKIYPSNRCEEEILGYREVLKIVHADHEYLKISSNYILQMHRELYAFSGKSRGGHFKNSDNSIVEIDEKGDEKIRFKPISAFQTADYVNDLCDEYNKAVKNQTLEELILIPLFVFDFLCIHPFNDGNGRMSRLITLLLLYKHDYSIGKYISLERLIENTKETYYESLQVSGIAWHENKNNYEPFIRYFLGIMIKAYEELEIRIDDLGSRRSTKTDRVANIVLTKLGKFTKSDILAECYDVSKITVERTLNNLLKQGKIIKHSNGPTAFYTVNYD